MYILCLSPWQYLSSSVPMAPRLYPGAAYFCGKCHLQHHYLVVGILGSFIMWQEVLADLWALSQRFFWSRVSCCVLMFSRRLLLLLTNSRSTTALQSITQGMIEDTSLTRWLKTSFGGVYSKLFYQTNYSYNTIPCHECPQYYVTLTISSRSGKKNLDTMTKHEETRRSDETFEPCKSAKYLLSATKLPIIGYYDVTWLAEGVPQTNIALVYFSKWSLGTRWTQMHCHGDKQKVQNIEELGNMNHMCCTRWALCCWQHNVY